MPKTSPRVSFGLYAIEIKQSSIPSMSADLQPFSKILDLKTDNVNPAPFITYEPDYWLLNGKFKFIPENIASVHTGLVSLQMSNDAGVFDSPPVLVLDFERVHTTDGISLQFSQNTGDYCSQLIIQFYNAADELISYGTYTPSDTEFSVNVTVEDFKKITIIFQETNRPYRYLRLLRINYGKLLTFDGASIKTASVVEEMTPLSNEVRINTFELGLFSQDAQFSILNPEGYYVALKERQPLAVYEIVDGSSIFIGQYYLDKWENTNDTEIKFTCIDLLGILDTIPYRGGIWIGSGIKLQVLLQQMLEEIYVPYDLDVELYDIDVIGWIPASTYREALQQIAFAVGASLDCSRSWTVKFYKSKIAADEEALAMITKAEKGKDQSLTLRPLVTGVEVIAHDYVESTDTRELYSGVLSVGEHEIIFREPMHDLDVSGAVITENGANYAILEVSEEGEVILSGEVYLDTTRGISIKGDGLGNAVRPNILKVSDAYLVNSGNLSTVAQRIYDYHQQRYSQKVKLFAPSVEVGNVVLIDTLYGKQLRGVVEKMKINLADGFMVNAEIVGAESV